MLRANAVRQMAWSGLSAVKVERVSAFAEGRAVASGCHWQPWWLCGACDAEASACVYGLVWRCPCVLSEAHNNGLATWGAGRRVGGAAVSP